MGKRKGANRSWRAHMNKYLAENPQAHKDALKLNLDRANALKESLKQGTETVDAEIAAIQAKIDAIDVPTEA